MIQKMMASMTVDVNPKMIINSRKHGIHSHQIPSSIHTIVRKLHEHGYQAYIVGGAIRDILLNLQPKDFDIVTDARPDEIKKIFNRRARIIGRRFKLVHVMMGGQMIEVATFRGQPNRLLIWLSGIFMPDRQYLNLANAYGDLHSDMIRRDFSCNAMYLDTTTMQIIDNMGGYEALASKRLIMIGDLYARLLNDPCRIFRGIRFASQLDLRLSTHDLQVFKSAAPLLDSISRERISLEIDKLFRPKYLSKTLSYLKQQDCLSWLVPCVGDGYKALAMLHAYAKRAPALDIDLHAHKALISLMLMMPLIDELLEKAHARRYVNRSSALSSMCRSSITSSELFITKRIADIMCAILANQVVFSRPRRPKLPANFFTSKNYKLSLLFMEIRSDLDKNVIDSYRYWSQQ